MSPVSMTLAVLLVAVATQNPPAGQERDKPTWEKLAAAAEDRTECPGVADVIEAPDIEVPRLKGRLVRAQDAAQNGPVGGAKIWLLRFAGSVVQMYEATTDATGQFEVTKLPEGRYLLKTCAPGVARLRCSVVISKSARNMALTLVTKQGT